MDAQTPPFPVQADDIARLNTCEGFQMIRQFLANRQGRPYGVQSSLSWDGYGSNHSP